MWYGVILDSLDRYRDVIGPELVTWYQLGGSKLLYFPGRSLFGVILTSWWNEYIFNQCMSPSWGLYVTNYTHNTYFVHIFFFPNFFFFNFFFYPLKLFFPHFLFFPKNVFWGKNFFFFNFFFFNFFSFFFSPKFVYNFFSFLELSRQIIFP